MLNLPTISINTITEEQHYTSEIAAFFNCRCPHWFSPPAPQPRLLPSLPNASHQFMDARNSETTCTQHT